jgi:hypothetical protein
MSTFPEDDGPFPGDDDDSDTLDGHINNRRADIPPESAAYLKKLLWTIDGDHATYRPPGKSDEVRMHLGKADIYYQYPDDTIRINTADLDEMLPGWYEASDKHHRHQAIKALHADAETRGSKGMGRCWQDTPDDGSHHPKASLICSGQTDLTHTLSLLEKAHIHVFRTPTIDGLPTIVVDARHLRRAGIVPKQLNDLDLPPKAEHEQASAYLRALRWQAVQLPAADTFITLPNEQAELAQDSLLSVHCTQFTIHANNDATTTLTVSVNALKEQIGTFNISLAQHSQRARPAPSTTNQTTSRL